MTLRSRLALLTTTAVALAILAASLTAWLLTRSTLISEIDDRLRELVAPAGRLAQVAESGAPAGPSPQISSGEAGQLLDVPIETQIVGPGGTVVRRFPADGVPVKVGATEAELLEGEETDTQFRTETIDGERYRVASALLPNGNVVQMARSLQDVDDAMARLTWLLVGVAAVGVGLAGGLGWVVARAGLRPVDRLTRSAEQVATTKDLAHRIEVDGRGEVARLAGSVNAMLEALDTARTQQRQLVEDAGHELRTPLTTLRNDLGLLVRTEESPERTLPPEDRAALIRDLESEAAALSDLVNEVVDLARGEVEPEPLRETDLRALVERAVARTRRVNPAVTVSVRGNGGSALVRPATLERAVANLVRNALQVSPPGETVEVILRGAGGWATLRVLDHGPGLAAEDLPRLFDRFFRGRGSRERQGSGLGLAIVAQAAAQHGGTVEAGTRPGGGAVFTLRVPLHA